jgi:hypothetical protein
MLSEAVIGEKSLDFGHFPAKLPATREFSRAETSFAGLASAATNSVFDITYQYAFQWSEFSRLSRGLWELDLEA